MGSEVFRPVYLMHLAVQSTSLEQARFSCAANDCSFYDALPFAFDELLKQHELGLAKIGASVPESSFLMAVGLRTGCAACSCFMEE